MEYIRDWRIWLICFVIFLVIQISDWAWAEENWKRFDYQPDKPKQESVDFKPFDDLRFKWKLNTVEARYNVPYFETTKLRCRFQVDENFNNESLVLLSFEF